MVSEDEKKGGGRRADAAGRRRLRGGNTALPAADADAQGSTDVERAVALVVIAMLAGIAACAADRLMPSFDVFRDQIARLVQSGRVP